MGLVWIAVLLSFLQQPVQSPDWLTEPFTIAVATRCSGESSADVWECACTVRPTEKAIVEAKSGLHGLGCSPDWYYLMSASDLRYLGWSQDDATGKADKVFMFKRTQWGN